MKEQAGVVEGCCLHALCLMEGDIGEKEVRMCFYEGDIFVSGTNSGKGWRWCMSTIFIACGNLQKYDEEGGHCAKISQ